MYKIFNRFSQFAAALALGLVLSAGALHADLTYDANADFLPTSTASNGVWSYGYRSAYNGAGLTLFDVQTTDPTYYGLTRTGAIYGTPALYHVTNGPIYGVPTGGIALHGGTQGDDTYAVLRFTSPIAAIFDVSAFFSKGDKGVTDNFVLYNGVAVSSDTDNIDSNGTYTNSLFLGIGDTIELVVGIHDDVFYDSTPVGLTLTTSAVPEPTSICLACSGLAAVALRRRSLKWFLKRSSSES